MKKKPVSSVQETRVSEFFVAGLVYGDFDVSTDALNRGAKLTLTAEPTNPYDANAIAVYHGKVRLGYVPRDQTAPLHQHRRSGVALRTVVHQFAPTNPTQRTVLVHVFKQGTAPDVNNFASY